jgi:hypothetical protein
MEREFIAERQTGLQVKYWQLSIACNGSILTFESKAKHWL